MIGAKPKPPQRCDVCETPLNKPGVRTQTKVDGTLQTCDRCADWLKRMGYAVTGDAA